VESPLEIIDGLDSLRMRNDLTRIPLLSRLCATNRINKKIRSKYAKGVRTLTRSSCTCTSDSRDNLSSARFFSAAVMSTIASSRVLLSACHSSRALSNVRFVSARDVLVCSSSCSTFFRVLCRASCWAWRQVSAQEKDTERNEYTHDVVSCASVEDLYSSCVAFSDANASSLA
jgi:hypothetical protein